MARGDLKWFAAFDHKSKTGTSFNLHAADTIKMGIITNAQIPAVDTADPRWGAGGAINFSTAQVGVATAYTGPITLINATYTRTAGVVKLDADDITIALDAAGFTNGYYAIIYDDTVAGKFCIGYIDLGGPVSIQSGPLNFNVNAAGLLTATAA